MALLIARVESRDHYGLDKEAIETTGHAVAVITAYLCGFDVHACLFVLIFTFGLPVEDPGTLSCPSRR